MAPEVEIRPVTPADLDAIARIHLAAFPSSAIGALGHEAVRRYYAWQCAPVHDAHNTVAIVDGRVVGFCFGGVFRGAMGGYLKHNALHLAVSALRHPQYFLQPRFRGRVRLGVRLMARLAARRLRLTPPPAPTPSPAAPPTFGILAIATDPTVQKRGVGRALMYDAEREAERRGFPAMMLTVHPSNEGAVAFYERIGWTRVRSAGDAEWAGEMQLRFVDRADRANRGAAPR